jgi:hypothetical protein
MSKKNGKPEEKDRVALGVNVVLEDPDGKDAAPTLFDILAPRFKDGKCTRLGASLSLRVVGGFYVIRIGCPSEQAQATFTLHTLASLLADLERNVQSSSCVWLPDYDSQKRARRDAQA